MQALLVPFVPRITAQLLGVNVNAPGGLLPVHKVRHHVAEAVVQE